MKNSIVLVTGGAGAIGINLINELLFKQVEKIVILDNLSSGDKSFLPQNDKIDFFPIDIFRFDELKSIFNKYIFFFIKYFISWVKDYA